MFDQLVGGDKDVRSNYSRKDQGSNYSRKRKDDNILNNLGVLTKAVKWDQERLEDMYRFPANIQSAKMHTNALRYGFTPPVQGNQKKTICSCCQLDVHTEKLKVFQDSTTIYSQIQGGDSEKDFKVSSSVAFFFTFIKYLVIMFLLRFLIVDGFNIFTNIVDGNYCEDECTRQFWTEASLVYKNKKQDLILATNILSFLTVLLSIPYFLLYRKFQYHMYSIIDAKNQTQDDYTIFVEYIPILNFPTDSQQKQESQVKFEYDKDLDNLFTEEINKWINNDDEKYQWSQPEYGSLEWDYKLFYQQKTGQSYSAIPFDIVKSINLCYDITSIERIGQIRKQVMTEYESLMAKSTPQSILFQMGYSKSGKQQVYFLNNSELKQCQSFTDNKSVVFNTTHFVGSAFISFKYQHYRNHILEEYEKNKQYFQLKGKRLRITEATYPTDIKWQNLKLSRSERKVKVITSFVVLFLFLLFGFSLLVGSDRLKSYFLNKIKQQDQHNQILPQSVTLITTLATLAINMFLQEIAYRLTEWENHQNKSSSKFSLTVKLTITQFLNTAIIYFLLSILRQEDTEKLGSKDGLIFQVSSLIVVSGVIQIITNLVNVSALIRRLTIYWYYSDKSMTQDIPEFQINLNKKYQYIEFDISMRYAYYILQLWTVSAYEYIVPICGPAIALIMAIQFWVDKFNLFERSSLFYELNYNLSRRIVKLAEVSIFIYSLGVVVFSIKVNNYVHPLNIIGLVISFLFVLISNLIPLSLEKKLFQKYETCETYSYDECEMEQKFKKTYWTLNPATRFVNEGQYTTRKVYQHYQEGLFQFAKQPDDILQNMII